MNTAIVSELKRALTQGGKATAKGDCPWYLEMVFIDASSNHIQVLSTDLDKSSQGFCDAIVSEPFYTCVPKNIIDWLKTCDPKSTVQLDLTKRTQILTVKNDRSTAQFKCIDGDEFPWMGVLENIG